MRLLLSPSYRWRHWGTERLNSFPNFTKPGNMVDLGFEARCPAPEPLLRTATLHCLSHSSWLCFLLCSKLVSLSIWQVYGVSKYVLERTISSNHIHVSCHQSLPLSWVLSEPMVSFNPLPPFSQNLFFLDNIRCVLRHVNTLKDVWIVNMKFIFYYGISLGWLVGMGG